MRNLLILLAATVLASACAQPQGIQGTGSGGQRDYTVGAFDRIDATGIDNVVVTVGGQPAVRAEGDEAALERLVIRVDDNRLIIGRRNEWGGSNDGRATIRVTVPSLRGVSLTGTGEMRLSALQAPNFEGEVTGTGNLIIDRLEGETAEFRLTGTGDVQAAGRVRDARLRILGTGNGNLSGLESQNARISITGPGDAQMRATGTAEIEITGPGDATVTGGARCTISRTGPGEAHCQ